MAKFHRFTARCYAILAALTEKPDVNLNSAEKGTAGRLMEAGFLEKKQIQVEQSAGTFKYLADCECFVLTEAGKEKYKKLHDIYEYAKGIPEKDLRIAAVGEQCKEGILRRNRLEAGLELPPESIPIEEEASLDEDDQDDNTQVAPVTLPKKKYTGKMMKVQKKKP